MVPQAAAVYDAIYSYKDYAGEAARLHALIAQYGQNRPLPVRQRGQEGCERGLILLAQPATP